MQLCVVIQGYAELGSGFECQHAQQRLGLARVLLERTTPPAIVCLCLGLMQG